MYKVGIVGCCGHVGSCMRELFPDAVLYDTNENELAMLRPFTNSLEDGKIHPTEDEMKNEINECDFVFVCVPTPKADDGHCDTSIVEEVLEWLNPKGSWLNPKGIIILRSTVPVGFTHEMSYKYRRCIVFQPEYYGETKNHPFANPYNRSWITLGGVPSLTKQVAELYQTVFTSDLIINQVDSATAELAKYMENSFYSVKVTFCNQFYDLAEQFGIDYFKLCETWLLDPRIGRSHTQVYPDNRGYGGSCLPKDTAAIIYQGDQLGVDMRLLKATEEVNRGYHNE